MSKIITGSEFSEEQLAECISYITYSISLSARGYPILAKKIDKKEQGNRVANLWALFLLNIHCNDPSLVSKAWSAIKTGCQRYFADNEGKILFSTVPYYIKILLEQDGTINDNKKVQIIFELPSHFNYSEKEAFERYFMKNRPTFVKA